MKAEQRCSGTVSIRCVLSSTAEDVRKSLSDIAATLADSACPPSADDMWEVALAEVLNNVVEHAYKENPEGQIHMTLDFRDGELRARVMDRGFPIPGGVPPEGRPADLDVATSDLPEGGFGWFLIRALARHLDYRHENGINYLELCLPYKSEQRPT